MSILLGGELAALMASLLWAVASVVYTRLGTKISPLVLNWSKGMVGIALIGMTVFLRGDRHPLLESQSLVLLAFSGILGIGLGDTFFFESLRYIGPRRTLLIQTLTPALTAILALIFLQETLKTIAWLGVLLTTMGVTWVISERTPQITIQSHAAFNAQSSQWMRGVIFSLLAAIVQGVGVVLSRSALADTTTDPLWSTLVRLVAGTGILFIWLPLQGEMAHCRNVLQSKNQLGAIALTAFFSTYLGIWLQQVSVKYTAAGIAQALGSTSPLFVLPLAVWTGDRLTMRSILGVAIALGGIGLLLAG